MYLSRFGVTDYKCLGDVDVPLTPMHVLIGPNDSGKTSLLEALAAYCASGERTLAEIFPQPWSARELVRENAESDRVRLFGQWTDASATQRLEYGFSVAFPEEGTSSKTADEWVAVDGERAELSRLSNTTFLHHSRKDPGAVSGRTHELLVQIKSVLRPAHKYSFDAKLMAIPAAINPVRRFRMDPDGFGLATLLDDIVGYDPELFLRLRRDFCEFFPQFKSMRVETESAMGRSFSLTGIHSASSQTGKGIYFETRSGKRIRAQQASDGALLFLGFLALVHLPEPPGLLLIEEPENGVYPKRLGEVIQLLKHMAARTEGVQIPQIIITTHSPYVVSLFEPEEVTFLGRPGGDPDAPVRARPLCDAPHLRQRLAGGEFYLGELWYNLTEEELFGEF
jgi:predicted ATPase